MSNVNFKMNKKLAYEEFRKNMRSKKSDNKDVLLNNKKCSNCPTNNDNNNNNNNDNNNLSINEEETNKRTIFVNGVPIQIDISPNNNQNTNNTINNTVNSSENNNNKNIVNTNSSCSSCPDKFSLRFSYSLENDEVIFKTFPNAFFKISNDYILTNVVVADKKGNYLNIDDKIITNTKDRFEFKVDKNFKENLFKPFILHADCTCNGKIISSIIGYM